MERVQIGRHTLIHADCLDVLPTLAAGSSNVVCTDPPYGARRPSAWRTASERFAEIEGNGAVNSDWIPHAFRLTAARGCCYAFCTWDTLGEWRAALTAAGYRVRSCIVWDKMAHGLGDLETCWAPQHELILFAAKGRHELSGHRPKDIVRVPKLSADELLHPYQKPVGLIRELLRTNSGTVLDPFLGSGTTAVACEQTGRVCVGVEKHRPYFDLACKRLTEAVNSTPLFPEPASAAQAGLFDEVRP